MSNPNKRRSLMRRSTGNRKVVTKDSKRITKVKQTIERITKLGGILLSLTAAGFGLYYGFEVVKKSPSFSLKEITIMGNRTIPEQEIISYAGLKLSTQIVDIDPNLVAERIIQHPWIKDASIQRQLPDKLVIIVTERTASAVISLDKMYLMDDEGEIFLTARPVQSLGLPIITGINQVFYTTQHEKAMPLIKDALGLYHTMQEVFKKKHSVAEIHIDQLQGYEVELLPGPVRLYMGFHNYKTKAERAKIAMQNMYSRNQNVRKLFLDNRHKPEQVVARTY